MIVIYGASWCSWCKKARELVERLELEYEYHDIEDGVNGDALSKLLAESDKTAKTIPQIWWNGNYVGGYAELTSTIENTMGVYGHGKI